MLVQMANVRGNSVAVARQDFNHVSVFCLLPRMESCLLITG